MRYQRLNLFRWLLTNFFQTLNLRCQRRIYCKSLQRRHNRQSLTYFIIPSNLPWKQNLGYISSHVLLSYIKKYCAKTHKAKKSLMVQEMWTLPRIAWACRVPSRDFSPNLKQDLSGLSSFLDDCAQNLVSKWAVFERFI